MGLGNAAVETLGAEVTRYMAAIPDDQKAPYDFLARRQEELLTPLAATLNEAAGTAGIHRWSLILPSSARVSLLTYQTVIGVRYLELVKHLAGEHRFGRFLTDFSAKRGAFCQSCGMPPNLTRMLCKTLNWYGGGPP